MEKTNVDWYVPRRNGPPTVAEIEMTALGGEPVHFIGLSKAVVRKIIWSLSDKDPTTDPKKLLAAARRAEKRFNIRAFTFEDGSVGVSTSSYPNSFYAKANGDDYLSAVQNLHTKKHAYPRPDRKETSIKDPLSGVRVTVEQEGFDYAFLHMSDFKEVDDKRFHDLRKAYIKAAKALSKHLGVDA